MQILAKLIYSLIMKVWLKYLIGIALGILTAVLLPPGTAQAESALNFIVEIVVRFGRYTLLPLLFFSVATAFFKLQEDRLLLKTGIWTGSIILISSAVLMALGLISSLVVRLPRIPITVEKMNDIPSLDWENLLRALFPYSGFEALLDGAYLLPCFVLAGIAGMGAAVDKSATKSAVSLFESLSRLFYIVMSFFSEVLAVGMIAIMCRWTLDFIFVLKAKVYLPLILMLSADLFIMVFVIYPLVLRFLCHDPHPFRVLYAGICPFMAAFFSGDTNLALQINMRHGKESLGIRSRVNSVTFPLFSIFGRGGAAWVTAVCFVLVFRSYSSLRISFSDIMWVAGLSFILSFALMQIPYGGPFIAVTVMCVLYGRGFEAGYLLLKDASPVICSFAAGMDAITAMVGSYIVGVKTGRIRHQELKKFI